MAASSSSSSIVDEMEIMPLGAGCEVGRSCCIVKYRGSTIMFDCGLHPGKTGLDSLPYFDAVDDLSTVDLLLVTHFHMDHCGAVPYLTEKTNFYQVKKLIALESNEPPEPTPRVVAISDYFILNHKSNFVILWDVLMGVLCVYTAFFYAYASLFDLYDMRAPDRWTAEIV